MPEARVLGGIDVERARDSVFGRKLMEHFDANSSDFAKFVSQTGFDPRRDLREVIFATADTKGKNPPALVLVRGVFDTARINSFVKGAGIAATENINGIDFFTKPDAKNNDGFAILDSTMALAGHKDAVRAALVRRGGKGAPMPAETFSKVQSISRDNDIWLISTVPVAEFSDAIPSNKAPQQGQPADPMSGMLKGDAFKGIEQASLGVRFAAELMQLTAETISATEKDATAIADVIRFLATMVQMNREKPEMKTFADALDSMKLTTEAKTTRLILSVPTAEIEQIIQKGKKPAARI
jgi:hypothetical protein